MAVTQPRMQEFLRHHFLFQTLNEKALSEIIERSAVMGFTPDKDILHEGSECKGFYIIFRANCTRPQKTPIKPLILYPEIISGPNPFMTNRWVACPLLPQSPRQH